MTRSKMVCSALAALLTSLALLSPALADRPNHNDRHGDRRHERPAQEAPLLEAPGLSAHDLKRVHSPVLVDADELRRELSALHRDLDDLRALTAHLGGQDLQARLCHQLTQTAARVASLERHLQRAPRLQPAVAFVAPAAPRHQPATPERFASIDEAIQRTYSSRDRLDVLRSVSPHNHFSTAQIAQLTERFYGSSQRLDALLTLVPRATDPENLHQLYALLYSSSDRKRLIEAVQHAQR